MNDFERQQIYRASLEQGKAEQAKVPPVSILKQPTISIVVQVAA